MKSIHLSSWCFTSSSHGRSFRSTSTSKPNTSKQRSDDWVWDTHDRDKATNKYTHTQIDSYTIEYIEGCA
jgi:hypothetical protein